MKAPDIAIMLAKRGHDKSGEDGDDSMYETMARDALDAIKEDDATLLAEIFRALATTKSE